MHDENRTRNLGVAALSPAALERISVPSIHAGFSLAALAPGSPGRISLRSIRPGFSLVALGLFALGLTAAPLLARAQDTKPGDKASAPAADLQNRLIDLDVESGNLYAVLELLFDKVKANYTLDPALKQAQVTAHFHQVPLGVALGILLKSSGQPLTYHFENNVYSIVPKTEQPPANPVSRPQDDEQPAPPRRRAFKIHSYELVSNAIDIVTMLGGRILGPQNPFGSGGLGGAFTGQNGFGAGQGAQGGQGTQGAQGSQGAAGAQGGQAGAGGNQGGNFGIASGLLPAGINPGDIYALANDNSIIVIDP